LTAEETIAELYSDPFSYISDTEWSGRVGEKNAMKINPYKSKAVSFMRARVKDSLNYYLGDERILEVSSCKYLGIIIRSDLSWADPSKLHNTKSMEGNSFYVYSKKGNSNTKSLAYTSLVCPILACCVPYKESKINALHRVQKKAAKFANNTSDSVWEILAQRRKIARICALFQTHSR